MPFTLDVTMAASYCLLLPLVVLAPELCAAPVSCPPILGPTKVCRGFSTGGCGCDIVSAKRSWYSKAYVLIHTDEKPHECDICKKSTL